MTGFQKTVNNQPSPGVEGSRASGNPPVNYVTGPGGLVAGPAGCIVGRFAFASYQTDGSERADNISSNIADGLDRSAWLMFVLNKQQASIVTYLAESGTTIVPGMAMEGFTRGDFWCKMLGAATRNQKVFASLLDGSAIAGAAGATIAPNTFTASFATNVMTVTVAPALPLKVGQAVASASVASNTYIKALGTGTGGTGTYTLTTTPGTIAAQAATGTDYVETKFKVLSAAQINEIAKIGFGD